MKHNIYLLLPTDKMHVSYDCNDGQVVIADNEEEARELCEIKDEGGIWTIPEYTSCVKIGESDNEKGIVLISNMGA